MKKRTMLKKVKWGAVFRRIGAMAMVATVLATMPGCVVGAMVGGMAESYRKTGTRAVAAEYQGLRGKSFAVLINADRVIQASHPGLLTRITNTATRVLADPGTAGASGYVPGPLVLEFQYNNPDWTAWSYERLMDEFVVDRLVVIEIYEYRLHEPGNSHVWEGVMAGKLGVAEIESYEPNEFSFSREVIVGYPDDSGYTTRELSEQHVRASLETRFVERSTWTLYDHKEPYYPKY